MNVVNHRCVAAGGVTLLLAPLVAWAQSGRLSQDGRALDANRGVGSGGYNATRYDAQTLNSSNRYITGNVTGLGQFRGYSPIRDVSQFQDGLPSAGLSFFNRQAVSTGDVLSGRTQAGLGYYGRSETVVNVGGIVAGRNAPGSSMPLNVYTTPYRANLTRPPVAEPEWRDPQRLRTTGEALSPDAAQPIRPPVTDANALPVDQGPSPYARARGSSLFGADLSRDRGRDGSDALRPDRPTDLGDDETRPATPSDSPPLDDTLPEITPSPTPPKTLGSNLFADLLGAVRTAQQRDRAFLGNLSAARIAEKAEAATSAELLGYLTPDARKQRQDAQTHRDLIETQERAMANAARWARDLLTIPISTFAASTGNTMNGLIAAGEAELKAGRYYSAQSIFERARALDPANPLIDLACGHALAAGGDYVSAVRALESGLSRFPEVATLRLDLPALMGGTTVIEARCADLQSLIQKKDSPALRFLLGYLQYYSGMTEAGLSNVIAASRAAESGTMIARFPAMLVAP